MPSPTIEQLLILQDRDTKRLGVEAQVKAVPREIAAVEQRIASEKAAIDAAKGEVRELESRKKILETEIGSAETQRGKYQTQQLSVKKNDEYPALGPPDSRSARSRSTSSRARSWRRCIPSTRRRSDSPRPRRP